MTTPATRLLTLITLLQRKPNQKAAELATALDVSVRTLHRYVGMLEGMGIPIYAERGPQGGFSLVRGYKLPPLIFSPDEAVALQLGANLVDQMWGALYHEAARDAVAKLDNVLPDEQRAEIAWARRSLIATGMHRADPAAVSPFLAEIRLAARARHQIKMTYQSSSNSEPSERMLDPYALVHRHGWWYLVGYCHLRQALRTFRVDRIQQLELLSQSFEMMNDFDIEAYLDGEFQDQPVIRARLRFVSEAVHIARTTLPGWEAAQENPDGSVDVTLAAPDLYWLASMTLSFGAWVTVLDPPELRALVYTWARETTALYADEVDKGESR